MSGALKCEEQRRSKKERRMVIHVSSSPQTMADYGILLKHWGKVEADYDGHGNLFMTRLFKKHPDTQKMFPKFADIAQADLASNAHVTALGSAVLKKLGEVLKAGGNHAAILKPVAKSHAEKLKIPFDKLQLLIDAVAEIIKEKAELDADGQQALKGMMAVVHANFEATYKELGLIA
ncbi:myoglobin-like [Epinephelus fuscoguttatus]|uniref:myoglobin-like n=1 Tax=Epinephelus fuscoguttatus TaxID=293821 RepID=UPI0020D0D3CB|nr:myoglobin-like [Epinephelus fuscoguttatus]